MPIGAAIGGAVLAGGATVASGAMGASAQKDAANTAADTSIQTTQMNNDLFRETRGQNIELASPFYNNGLLAGNALTDLLLGTHTYNPAVVSHPSVPGGGTLTGFPASGATGGTGTGALSGYSGPALGAIGSQSQMDAYMNYYRAHPDQDPGFTSIGQFHGDAYRDEDAASGVLAARNAYLSAHPATAAAPATGSQGALAYAAPNPAAVSGPAAGATATRPALADYRGNISGFRDAMTAYRAGTPTPATGTVPATGTGTGTGAAGGAQSAWNQFRQGTNYQWRLGEGERAVNSGWAARGALDSGAAEKAIVKFGQNFASNELANYMNLLAGQQATGLSAAGAVMGVNTSAAGNIAAQNTAAANAAANAAMASGQANAGMWGSIGQGVGQIGGALYQYGMGQQQPQQSFAPASGGYNTNTGGTGNYFAAHPFG